MVQAGLTDYLAWCKKENQRLDKTKQEPKNGHDRSDHSQLCFVRALDFPGNVLRSTADKTCWCCSNEQIDHIEKQVSREAVLKEVENCPEQGGHNDDKIPKEQPSDEVCKRKEGGDRFTLLLHPLLVRGSYPLFG